MRADRPTKSLIDKIVALSLIVLALYANLIAINRLRHYAVQVDFYNKLSVAYDIGGRKGVENTLVKIRAHDEWRREQVLADEFEPDFYRLKDPEQYIDGILYKLNQKIRFISNLRILAIIFIFMIVILRILPRNKLLRPKKA